MNKNKTAYSLFEVSCGVFHIKRRKCVRIDIYYRYFT